MGKQIRIIFLMLLTILILWVVWVALVFSRNITAQHTSSDCDTNRSQKTLQSELVKPTKIYKNARSMDDPRQKIVQETYKQWWMDKVILFECEWYDRDMYKKWDQWHAVWLCQMNDRFHNIPNEYYNSREFQIEYCIKKRDSWTLFYWPDRADRLNWEKCMSYANRNFYFE